MQYRVARRDVLLGMSALAACGVARVRAAQGGDRLQRQIPSTGELLPVVGIGTNAYDVTTAADLALRREVLAAMPGLGAKVIDTARGYGRSEEVLGELIAGLGTRDDFFVATKPISAPQAGLPLTDALIDESFRNLRMSRIDLLQIHSLVRVGELLPRYREYRQEGRIRYLGITTASSRQFPQFMAVMREHRPDFIQVNYSIDDREAAAEVLPLAAELGIAVLNNVPFGGSRGSLFPRLAGKALPAWAAEFGARSWAQFMLKYNLAHPAVTAIIPGTTTLAHLRDNQHAAQGPLPDAAQRRRMEEFWSTV